MEHPQQELAKARLRLAYYEQDWSLVQYNLATCERSEGLQRWANRCRQHLEEARRDVQRLEEGGQ